MPLSFSVETFTFFSGFFILFLALLLDKILGEPKKYHHLVGFGALASKIEQRLNLFHYKSTNKEKISFSGTNASLGFVAWSALVLPLPFLYWFYLSDLPWYWQALLDAFILYLAIGMQSLKQHAIQVYKPIINKDLTTARHFTGYLVSRNTNQLTPQEMSRAVVESVLENGHDAVIASLIYYLIGGIPLVILHRLANTLDAMWGYRNEQYISFGFASAKLDDMLGFLTGKCCSFLYALQRPFLRALRNSAQQGKHYKSHNGGWVMAAGATVMRRCLGGSAQYHGQTIQTATLGEGQPVEPLDIPVSINVVERACFWLLGLMFIISSVQLCFYYA